MDIQNLTGNTLLEAVRSAQSLFSLRLRRHPEQAGLFCKYGAPDAVAAIIRQGSSSVFFDNKIMLMTEQYLLNRENPESLLIFPHALAAYPELHGKHEYLIVHDRWGDVLRYPFAVGQKQVFRIDILLDKLKKNAPECRIGHRPEDLAYVRQHTEPLPKTQI